MLRDWRVIKGVVGFIKADMLGKNRLKYLFWSLAFLLGMLLAFFLRIEASPFTIMCGGVVAALLSYLSLETSKEAKAKEIEEEIFKELEDVFYKYVRKGSEVLRLCARNKRFFQIRKDLEVKKEEKEQLTEALEASESLLYDVKKNKENYEGKNYDIDVDEMMAHRNWVAAKLNDVNRDISEIEKIYKGSEEILEEVGISLSDSYTQYGDFYHDLQSLLEVFKSVHNRGGEKADGLAKKVYLYDMMIDNIYSSTVSPIRKSGSINPHPAKKSLLHLLTTMKSEVYRRIDQSSDFYIIKNRVILAAVVGTVFMAAGYNVVDGESERVNQGGVVIIGF